MLAALLGAALRGGALLAVVWVLLKASRLRDLAAEKNIWTLVVTAALTMPLLAWMVGAVAPPLELPALKMLASPSLASVAALPGAASGSPGAHLALLCAFVYAAGAAVLLTRLVTGLWIGVRLRRTASRVSSLHAGSLDVRVSAAIRSPASFASTILLPPAYASWDDATLVTVLAHEQAHIRNGDCYRLWLAALYRAVFWFDPLAHWLHWRLRALSELTSDEAAAAAVGDRAAYGATLEQLARPPEVIPSTLAMADSRTLGWRLRRLSSGQGACALLSRPWRALLLSVVLVMVALVAVPWAGAMVPAARRLATLEFHLVDEQNDPYQAQQSGAVPRGDQLYEDRDGTPILLERDRIATGDELTQAVAISTQQGPAVSVRMDARGAASMLHATSENVGHRLAVVYEGQVISDAVIRGAFGRQFEVTGLSAAQAHALAMLFGRSMTVTLAAPPSPAAKQTPAAPVIKLPKVPAVPLISPPKVPAAPLVRIPPVRCVLIGKASENCLPSGNPSLCLVSTSCWALEKPRPRLCLTGARSCDMTGRIVPLTVYSKQPSIG